MTDTQQIKIVLIVGNNICVTAEDGEKIYKAILQALQQGKNVQISFKGVEDITSLFLSAAIGQLYDTKGLSEQEIRERLTVVDATNQDLETLVRTVERAKEYFKDPERFHSATDEILGEDSE